MHLYAAGFNAWRQLEFLSLGNSTEEPDDISSFQKVLSDKFIEVQYASLTYTIGKRRFRSGLAMCLISGMTSQHLYRVAICWFC